MNGDLVDPYYILDRQNTWTFRGAFLATRNYTKRYLSYDYLFANNIGYAIFNDFPANTDVAKKKSNITRRVMPISSMNTMLAYLYKGRLKKEYLFGDPGDEDIARFSVVEMNAHSEDAKSYATLMIERKGHKKKAYIVWITF